MKINIIYFCKSRPNITTKIYFLSLSVFLFRAIGSRENLDSKILLDHIKINFIDFPSNFLIGIPTDFFCRDNIFTSGEKFLSGIFFIFSFESKYFYFCGNFRRVELHFWKFKF